MSAECLFSVSELSVDQWVSGDTWTLPNSLCPRKRPTLTHSFPFLSPLGSKWGLRVLPTARCCGEPLKFLFTGSDEERVIFLKCLVSIQPGAWGRKWREQWLNEKPHSQMLLLPSSTAIQNRRLLHCSREGEAHLYL